MATTRASSWPLRLVIAISRFARIFSNELWNLQWRVSLNLRYIWSCFEAIVLFTINGRLTFGYNLVMNIGILWWGGKVLLFVPWPFESQRRDFCFDEWQVIYFLLRSVYLDNYNIVYCGSAWCVTSLCLIINKNNHGIPVNAEKVCEIYNKLSWLTILFCVALPAKAGKAREGF